jgi:YesN/AraC family two-component response regulator
MAIIQVPVVTDYILIVEDEIPLTLLLNRILDTKGEVHLAYNGREGLEYIMKQDYDLVITDSQMPELDGMEFYTQAIVKKPHLKGRFLFMAGEFSYEQLAYFKKYGIEHLIKPASAKDIRIVAQRILLLTKAAKVQD